MTQIILASASPRRKELLQQVGIPFSVEPSTVDEESVALSGTPGKKAETLALEKAREVAGRCCSGLVLGADTVVALGDKIYGKPVDAEDALRVLSQLAGKKHQVITGIALIDTETGVCRSSHEVTEVSVAPLSGQELQAYIDTGEPFGKAGAYAIQGMGALLVEGISGCYSNVVGLPLMRLKKMLAEFGIDLLR